MEYRVVYLESGLPQPSDGFAKAAPHFFVIFNTICLEPASIICMDAPTGLKHTPIVSISDYDSHDGLFKNATDAKALSIGYAQYGDHTDISMKVLRHPNERWSAQSEELPVHRVLDLAYFYLCIITDNTFDLSALGRFKENLPHDIEEIKHHYNNPENDIVSRIKDLSILLNKCFPK